VADLLPNELKAAFLRVVHEIDTYAQSDLLGYFAKEMQQDRIASENCVAERSLRKVEATGMTERNRRRRRSSWSESPRPRSKRKVQTKRSMQDSSFFIEQPFGRLGRGGGADMNVGMSALSQRRATLSQSTLYDQNSNSERSVTLASQDEEVVEIKSESERAQHSAVEGLRSDEIVTIHTSRSYRQHVLPLTKLNASRVLQKWLVAGESGSFIFHPALLDVDAEIFARMVQFLIEGEYAPKVVETPGPSSTYRLLGVVKSSGAYSQELEKAASLYVLGQQFEIPALCDHIFTKVISTQYGECDRLSLLRSCEIIFRRHEYKDGVVDKSAKPDLTKDNAMEDWLITMVAERFQELARWCPDQFFRLEQCNFRAFSRRMHQKRGEMVDGPDLVIQIDP
jgi:hypothetical protein